MGHCMEVDGPLLPLLEANQIGYGGLVGST